MAGDLFEQLKRTDVALLAELVGQAQRSPDVAILDWAVEPLGKGFGEAEGLFLFRGHARLGMTERPWSLVLKILKAPEQEQRASDYVYWKRELLVAQSQWLANLPAPLRAQRIYRAVEQDGLAWLWMEHVQDVARRLWTLDEYALAARQLGQWHGVYLAGGPQPNEPWLCRDHLRGWLSDQTPEGGWDNSEVRARFSDTARARHQALWADLERFLSASSRLPQVFSHYDFQRRNLFICTAGDQHEQVVAIDWALCGSGPLGGDLYHLVGISAGFFDFEAERVRDLDAAAFAAYVDGLRSAGWAGDARRARLGYCIWAAAYGGAVIPAIAALFTSEEGQQVARQSFGVSSAEVLDAWSLILDYCLDCADEARLLINELGLKEG